MCTQTRLLEGERAPTDPYEEIPKFLEHGRYLLTDKAIQLPIPFQVSSEARAEAKKIYSLVNFTNVDELYRPAWFNPASDIIYFGEGTCMKSIVRFLSKEAKAIPIERVAVYCSGIVAGCCD